MTLSRNKRKHQSQFSFLKSSKALLLITLLALLSYSTTQLNKTEHFPIQRVKVYGLAHVQQNELQQLLQPLVQKGFFSIDVENIKDRLLKLAWVSDVSVRRIWPNKIIVTIFERKAVARWNKNSLLSSNGEIFTPSLATFPTDVPTLVGPEGQQIEMLENYAKINSIIAPLHFKISQLELTPYMAWNMTFENGIKLSAGHKDVLTRLHHFVKVYPKIIGQRATDVDYVDLRYPNGLAVRWKSIT